MFVVLVYVIDFFKKRFGKDKFNGPGGKMESTDRSVVAAACRETKEEVSLSVDVEDARNVGCIEFIFENKPDWNQHCYLYKATKYEGEEKETEGIDKAKAFFKPNNKKN